MDIYVDSTVLHSIASIYIYGHYSVRSRTLRLSYSRIWTLHYIILVYGHYNGVSVRLSVASPGLVVGAEFKHTFLP